MAATDGPPLICGAPSHITFHLIFEPWRGVGVPWWLAWLGRCLKPGFGHVSVLWFDPRGKAWCWAGKLSGGLHVCPVDGRVAFADLAFLYEEATVVLPVRRPCRAGGVDEPFMMLGVMTCVSVVKAVLGLRAPWVVTPWQLYRRIRGEVERAQAAGERG